MNLTFSDDIPGFKPKRSGRSQHVTVVSVNLPKPLRDRAGEVKRIRCSEEYRIRSRPDPFASEMHAGRFHGEPMPDSVGLVFLKPLKGGRGFLRRDQSFPHVSFHCVQNSTRPCKLQPMPSEDSASRRTGSLPASFGST